MSLTSVRQFGQTIDGSKRNSPLALRGRLAQLARHALSVDAAINRDLQAAQRAANACHRRPALPFGEEHPHLSKSLCEQEVNGLQTTKTRPNFHSHNSITHKLCVPCILKRNRTVSTLT